MPGRRRLTCSLLLAAVAAVGCNAPSTPPPDEASRIVRLAPETSAARHDAVRTPRHSAATSTRAISPTIADPVRVAAQFVIDSQRCGVDPVAARSLRDLAAPAVADRAIRNARPKPDVIAPRTMTVAVTDTLKLGSDENRYSRQYRVTFDRVATGPDGVRFVTRAMSLNVTLGRVSNRWVVSEVTPAAN